MQVRISGGLYASILFCLASVTQFMTLTSPLIEASGQEAWISALLGGGYGLALTLLVAWICSRFPGRDPLAAATPWLSVPIRLLYAVLQLLFYSLALRDITDFIEVVLLPGTPGILIGGVLCAVSLYAVMNGLEPMARVAFGATCWSVLVLSLLPVGLTREFNILQIDPFLWEGPIRVLRGAVVAMPGAGEALLVLSLLRHLSPKVNPYKWTLIGLGGGVLVVAYALVLITLVFGSVLPGRQIYPGFELLAVVSITEGIERLQAAVITVWIFAAVAKIAGVLYGAVEEGGLALGLRRRQLFAPAVAGLAASRLWKGVLQEVTYMGRTGWVLALITLEVAVVLLLAVAALAARVPRGRGQRG